MGKYVKNCGFGPDTPVGGSPVYRMTVGRSDAALHAFSPSFSASQRDDMVAEAGGTMSDFVAAMPAGVAAWFANQPLPVQTAIKASASVY